MWQRKQTIYLVLTIISMIGIGVLSYTELGNVLAFAPGSAIAVVCAIAIGQFSTSAKRKRQMMMCRGSQLLTILWLGLCAYIHFKVNASSTIPFHLFLMLASIIVLELAFRAIKHDEDLIRSENRIR